MSPSFVLRVTSRRLRRDGHLADVGRKEIRTEFGWESLLENAHLED
jgi:hypothetical protein